MKNPSHRGPRRRDALVAVSGVLALVSLVVVLLAALLAGSGSAEPVRLPSTPSPGVPAAPERPEEPLEAPVQGEAQKPAPAQDGSQEWHDDRTPKPEVVAPLSKRRVQVEVVGEGWGVKRAAREFGREIPGLRIFTRGSCAERPRAVCVRVVSGEFGEAEQHYLAGAAVGWYALTTFPQEGLRTVYLNTGSDPSSRYACAAHEFGHVLGLAHHDARGVDGRTPDVVHLSRAEIRALRSAYGEQR